MNYNGYTASTTEQEGSELTGVTLTELLPDTDYEIQVIDISCLIEIIVCSYITLYFF